MSFIRPFAHLRRLFFGRPVFYALLFLASASTGLAAQPADLDAFRVGRDGRIGTLDRDGKIVIEPIFECCGHWEGGFLWVRRTASSRFGGNFLTRQGFRLRAQDDLGDWYDTMFEAPVPRFRDGVAVVRIHDQGYAYIGEDGQMIALANPSVSFLSASTDTLVMRINDAYGYCDRSGNVIVPCQFSGAEPFHGALAKARLDGRWGIIGRDGAFLHGSRCDDAYPLDPSHGVWAIKDRGRWRTYDANSRCASQESYDELRAGSGRLLGVRIGNKWGLATFDGTMRVKPSFDDIGTVLVQSAVVQRDGHWGVVGSDGELIVAARYDRIDRFYPDSTVSEIREGQRVGWIGRDGRILLDPQFSHISVPRSQIAACRAGKRWGIVTTEGQVLSKPEYELIKGYENFKDGLAIVKHDNGWGLLDLTSNELVIPCAYTDLNRWNDLFAAEEKGVYTLFSMAGKEIVSAEFGITDLPKPHQMIRGYGIVRAKSGTGVITHSGVLTLPLEYENAGIPSEDLIPVKKGGQWGYLDMAGAVAITPQFTQASSFRDGMAAVKVGDKYGYIDQTGNQVVHPTYADAGYSLHGLLPVARTRGVNGVDVLTWGLINHQGEVVLPLDYDCVEWGDLENDKTRFYGRICWQQM